MMSINRYIFVAATAVYGGHAADDATATNSNSDHNDPQQIQALLQEQQARSPTLTDLGAVQWNTYMNYGVYTFPKGIQGFKAVHGGGFALETGERGVTMSAVAFASAYLSQFGTGLEKDDVPVRNEVKKADLVNAVDHVFSHKEIPSKWESSHRKRWNGVKKFIKKKWSGLWNGFGSSFVQRGAFKSHCRLTGESLDKAKVSEEKTGIKLSKVKRNGFEQSAEDSVEFIFKSVGFEQARHVFEIMTGALKPPVAERRRLLTELLKVDKFCESPVARTLMVQEFEALDHGTATYDERFWGSISQTPFFHVLASTPKFFGKFEQFKTSTVNGSIAKTWPKSIIVTENQVGVNTQAKSKIQEIRQKLQNKQNSQGKAQRAAFDKIISLIGNVEERQFNVFTIELEPDSNASQPAAADVSNAATKPMFTHTTMISVKNLQKPKCLQASFGIYSSSKNPVASEGTRYYGLGRDAAAELRPQQFTSFVQKNVFRKFWDATPYQKVKTVLWIASAITIVGLCAYIGGLPGAFAALVVVTVIYGLVFTHEEDAPTTVQELETIFPTLESVPISLLQQYVQKRIDDANGSFSPHTTTYTLYSPFTLLPQRVQQQVGALAQERLQLQKSFDQITHRMQQMTQGSPQQQQQQQQLEQQQQLQQLEQQRQQLVSRNGDIQQQQFALFDATGSF